jgi:hypothetical protein
MPTGCAGDANHESVAMRNAIATSVMLVFLLKRIQKEKLLAAR